MTGSASAPAFELQTRIKNWRWLAEKAALDGEDCAAPLASACDEIERLREALQRIANSDRSWQEYVHRIATPVEERKQPHWKPGYYGEIALNALEGGGNG